MSNDWSPVQDGTSQGPKAAILTVCGDCTVQALWSDTEGVVVQLDSDAVLDMPAVSRLCRTLKRLLKTQPPETRS